MILEKVEHDRQKVGLCHLWTDDLGDLVHGVSEGSPDFPTVISHHEVMHLLELLGPIRWSESLKDRREIVGAMVDDVVVDLQVGLRAAHFQVVVQEILVYRHLADYWSEELECRQFHPFRLILGQFVEELYDGIEFDFLTRYL